MRANKLELKAESDAIFEEYEAARSQLAIEHELGHYVRQKYNAAENHKAETGLSARLSACLKAKKREYSEEELELHGGIDIYVGICDHKSKGAESWITDILLNSVDKPFTLKGSPIPDLPDWLKEQVIDLLEAEIEELGQIDNVRERAKRMKTLALKYASKMAERAAERMERKIEDQLLEGNWRTEFAAFLHNLTVFPFAAIRAPVVNSVPHPKWDGNTFTIVQRQVWGVRNISPFDCYPSPDSTTPTDGEYFIERSRMAPSQLHACIGVPGFNEEALRSVLDEYVNGYSLQADQDSERLTLEGKDDAHSSPYTLDTILFNGKIQGTFLHDHGVVVPDLQQYYECEVWVVGNTCVRAMLNSHPVGMRPIYSTSFSKVPGSFAGVGVVELVRDIERMGNSTMRAMVRNLAYSSGPIGEIVEERLEDGETADNILPYRLLKVKQDFANSGSAVKFQLIPSVMAELLPTFQYFFKLADDFSNVPAYVLGNPQVAGAGRTLGGLSMMMGNAAKGIKHVLLNIDRDVIEKLVFSFYVLNMATSDDEDIKADAFVVSRGASGLLQRELSQTRTVELLNLLAPYVQQGNVPPESITLLLREVLKTTGLPVDDILADPSREEDLTTSLSRVALQNGFDRGTSNPVSLPPQSQPPNPTPTNFPQGN